MVQSIRRYCSDVFCTFPWICRQLALQYYTHYSHTKCNYINRPATTNEAIAIELCPINISSSDVKAALWITQALSTVPSTLFVLGRSRNVARTHSSDLLSRSRSRRSSNIYSTCHFVLRDITLIAYRCNTRPFYLHMVLSRVRYQSAVKSVKLG